jgi:hypothetical protein
VANPDWAAKFVWAISSDVSVYFSGDSPVNSYVQDMGLDGTTFSQNGEGLGLLT